MSSKMQFLLSIAKKMNYDEIVELESLIDWDKLGEKSKFNFDKLISSSHLDVTANDFASTEQKSIATFIYKSEISKIVSILNKGDLIDEIGGLRIIFEGETGTGKTSLVNELSNLVKEVEVKNIDVENLISHKMGQTQSNIMKLLNELNNIEARTIVFMDEIDSLLGVRGNENDVTEYSRIIATFIKFIDRLNSNIYLFAATNISESIDSAIYRRFNVKVKGEKFGIEKFINYFKLDTGMEMSSRILAKVIDDNLEVSFKLSDLSSFIENVKIEKVLNNKVSVEAEFIKFFERVLKVNETNLSVRLKRSINALQH